MALMCLQVSACVSADQRSASRRQRSFEGSPEWLAGNEAHRVHEYRASQWTQLANFDLPDSRAADEFLELCARNRREQDVEIAEIVAGGESPVPPAGWAP